MVKHVNGERRTSRPDDPAPNGVGVGLVSLKELGVMRAAIVALVEDAGGKDVPAWVRDFARVVETLATTYRRANELRRATLAQAAAIADECGAGEAAERIRGLA